MLVLTRQISESIVIGSGPERVVVQVVGVRRGTVQLGVTADRHVPVHREEVWKLLQEQKAAEVSVEG
jgi:carbon storage regulator